MSYYKEVQCDIKNVDMFKKACKELKLEVSEINGGIYFHGASGYRHQLQKKPNGTFGIRWETDERRFKVEDVIQMYSVVEAESALNAKGIKTARSKDKNGNLIVKAVGGPMGPKEMIVITADGKGKLSIDAKGFKTNKCADVTKVLDYLPGKKVAETKKPEYFAAEGQANKQSASGGA